MEPFSERNGIDLIKVIDAIKVRPTHSNMIFPGPRNRRLLPAKRRGTGDLGLSDPSRESVYLPEIAKTLISLGALDLFQNRMDQGQQHYEEALKIGRQLAQQNPAEYVPEVATTLANLGTVEGRQNRIDEARAHYQEALSLLLKLSQGDKKYAGDVANVEASLQELDKEGRLPIRQTK